MMRSTVGHSSSGHGLAANASRSDDVEVTAGAAVGATAFDAGAAAGVTADCIAGAADSLGCSSDLERDCLPPQPEVSSPPSRWHPRPAALSYRPCPASAVSAGASGDNHTAPTRNSDAAAIANGLRNRPALRILAAHPAHHLLDSSRHAYLLSVIGSGIA
jgi:hypothetical protein